MSGSPAWPLQQSVFTRLSADTELVTTLGAQVYDNVPSGAAFPYVVIGEDTQVPNDTMGTTGRDMTFTIHTFSKYVGKKQAKEIASRVDQLLDRWLPAVAGWNATHMLNEFGPETFMEPDGITRHGVSRYRVHITSGIMLSYNAGDSLASATFSRASTATYLDVNGVVQTALTNVARDAHYINGVRTLLQEAARTNHFLQSGTPATHTSPSLSTGTYTLWMVGTGSIAVAGNTATITGAGTATAGTSVTFVVTVAGTVTYTVSGLPTRAQSESGPFPSSYIPTTTTSVTRAADSMYLPLPHDPREQTIYVKGVELGTNLLPISSRLLAIGTANPTFLVAQIAGADRYRSININTAGAQVVSTAAAATAYGDTVEVRSVLASTGAVTTGQSINGGAEAVAATSSAQALEAAWSAQRLYVGTDSSGNPGFFAFQSVRVARGSQSLASMRSFTA